MATSNRNYTEVPPDTSPDVPYWVNQALGQVDKDMEAAFDTLDTGLIYRGNIPPGTDVNTLTAPGIYYTGNVTDTATLQNIFYNWPSLFIVYPGTTQVRSQEQLVYGDAPKRGYRISSSSTGWNAWQDVNRYRGELPAGTNIYDMRGPAWAGLWDIPGAAISSTLLGDPPPGETSWLPGQIEVQGQVGGSTNLSSIVYKPYAGSRPRVFYTTIKDYRATGADAYHTFVDLAAPPPPAVGLGGLSTGAPNLMRLQAFYDAYPVVSTGGVGAVMFRYDHGLTNIKAHILALHQARNFPFSIAMNSRRWDIEENSGATKSDVSAWVASGLAELWNHTATHEDTEDPAALLDIIASGRAELEADVSAVDIIHGFVVPGMSPTGMGGFYGGGNMDTFTKTLAGQLILAYHAVSTGSFANSAHRKLDGVTRQGQAHYTIEAKTVAEIKGQIDQAIANKTAVQFMMHPRLLNTSGHLSTEELALVLDYCQEKQAAGQLAVLSPYQSLRATL